MKRIFAAVIAVIAAAAAALLFAACSANGEGFRLRTVTTVPGAADTALPREIVLAVDSSGGDVLLAAAESFCETANTLSKSGIIFTAEISSSPVSDIRAGRAGLALVGGQEAGELHPFFNIADERFRYASYSDFSMVCNSEAVLFALSDACGLRVSAAYYTGSNVLVSHAPPDKLIGGSRASNQEAAEPTAVLYAIPGSGVAGTLSPFCLSADEIAPLSERIVSLAESNAITEFTPDELLRAGFADASAYAAIAEAAAAAGEELPEDGDYSGNLVFTRTSHSITPVWLILAPSLYESLPPPVRAAIDEAAAGMCADIDKFHLDRERAIFDMLRYESQEVSQDGSTLTRSRIMRYANENRGEVSAEEQRFLDALDRLR